MEARERTAFNTTGQETQQEQKEGEPPESSQKHEQVNNLGHYTFIPSALTRQNGDEIWDDGKPQRAICHLYLDPEATGSGKPMRGSFAVVTSPSPPRGADESVASATSTPDPRIDVGIVARFFVVPWCLEACQKQRQERAGCNGDVLAAQKRLWGALQPRRMKMIGLVVDDALESTESELMMTRSCLCGR